jgi:hypothetical protein
MKANAARTDNAPKPSPEALRRAAELVALRNDAIDEFVTGACKRLTLDMQYAPIMAEKLRHLFPKVQEVVYPELIAANGEVLPIDSSVDPADIVWEYYLIDSIGYAAWIDESGQLMPTSAIKMRRFTGRMAEMGHAYEINDFDLERAAKANVPISAMKGKIAKRVHDDKTNYTWLFGDASRQLVGVCNHPNINVSLAAQNAGNTSRLPVNKSNDEIQADIAALIDLVPRVTLRAKYVAKVFVTLDFVQLCRNRFIAATASGTISLWDRILDTFSGDDTGQGKVQFRIMNECDADLRTHPETGTDLSGIVGDFMLACPPDNVDDGCFIRARAFTQKPPRQVGDFDTRVATHSKIGGAKLQQPLAFHRMDFGTV